MPARPRIDSLSRRCDQKARPEDSHESCSQSRRHRLDRPCADRRGRARRLMGTTPDFGLAAAEYGRWRQGFPAAFFDALAAVGVGLPGQRVLDIGTGTGLMARELARRGCDVTGLDRSAALLAEARRLDAEAGVSVRHVEGHAEATGLPGAAFDVVTAAQCWHWFDRAAAARECLRLLAPGGRLVVAHLDWEERPGNVVEATSRLIERWSPAPAGRAWTFRYPEWLIDLVAAGFGDHRLIGFTTRLAYSHAGWVGRITASAQIGPALDAAQVAAFRAALSALLAERWPGEPLMVEHRVFAVVLDRE